MTNIKKLKRSFKYAVKGIIHVFRNEQNFRLQSAAAVIVAMLAFYFNLKTWEAIAVIMSIVMVLILELINTTFEKMIDIVVPRMHHYVKEIKDIMAATVLIASIAALIIGILIFWPYVLNVVF